MKKSIAIMTAAILCAALCACGKSESSQDSGDYIYGQISSISGNDVTLLLAEYTEQSSDDTSAEGAESAADGEGKPQDGGGRGGFGGGMPEGFDPENMPQGGFDPENMPEGFDPENMPQGGFDPENMPEGFDPENMPQGGFDSENMPEGFDPENMPQGGFDSENMPEGFDPENMPQGGFDRENMPEGFDPENMPQGGFDRENMPNRSSGTKIGDYTLTGETQEVRIPVGVTVTTALGVETDFDVLKTGDMIKCSMKTDSEGNQTVTAVWIVE